MALIAIGVFLFTAGRSEDPRAELSAARAQARGIPAPPLARTTVAVDRPLRGVSSFSFAWSAGLRVRENESVASYRFLRRHGMRMIRVPFYWGKIQPRLGGALDRSYLRDLRVEVARIKAAGMGVVLDLHSHCHWPNGDSGSACGNGISLAQTNDIWIRLSNAFKRDPGVIAYDIMNEPVGLSATAWEATSQSIVNAIRAGGDGKLLWIEGVGYAATTDWVENHPRPWIVDPANNFMYSAHQYFDGCGCYPRGFDYGAYPREQSAAVDGLARFTDWLARYGVRGSIGEVGWPSSRRTRTWSMWNALAARWYASARAAGLWVTYWSATSAYDEPNAAYDARRNGFKPLAPISVAETQSRVIEAKPPSG